MNDDFEKILFHHARPQRMPGIPLFVGQGSSPYPIFELFSQNRASWPNITLVASLSCEMFEMCHGRYPQSI
jgi:hypothetical protein